MARFHFRMGSKCAGQALIESCLVIMIVCIILFSALQLSQLYAAREIATYAAGRAARAETVGFNRFMVYKTYRVGAIPNAGVMTTPVLAGPGSSAAGINWSVGNGLALWNTALAGAPVAPMSAIENARIPLYMGAEEWGYLPAILDYADWDTLTYSSVRNPTLVSAELSQSYSLTHFPLHRLYYAADTVPLTGECEIENHASLYLEDMGW